MNDSQFQLTALRVRAAVSDCIAEVVALNGAARQATSFITPKLTVKATRQRKPDRRDTRTTILVSIGRPNYYEARIIKASLKAGVAFPMKSIYRKEYPAKKRASKK